MSIQMYGKERVVLRTGRNQIVAVCGVKEGHTGGNYSPVGYWYRNPADGRFYVDLKSEDQKYRPIARHEVAYRELGGFRTKAELRPFVLHIHSLEWDVYQLQINGLSPAEPAAQLNQLLGGTYQMPKYRRHV